MKYSMCSTWAKDRPVERVLEIAQRLGLDGVELWDGHIDEFVKRKGSVTALLALLQEMGLQCVVVAPYLDLISEAALLENLMLARKCIAQAQTLRCPTVRIFLGSIPSCEVTTAQWERCIGALRILTEEARQANVRLALEIHNDQPTDTKEAVLRLLRIIDSPALGVIFDGFNFYPSGLEMMEAFTPLLPYVTHFHFKNLRWSPHVCVPLGEGDADFRPLVRAIQKSGYDGWISFEYFAQDPSELIRDSKLWFEAVYREVSLSK